MPKTVDHDQRRAELAEAAWRLIAVQGIDDVTTRQIARESGYSNGVLVHYFKDKDDILLGALRVSHKNIDERYENAVAGVSPAEALAAVLRDNLPEDEQRALETRVEMSFWVRSLTNEELRQVQADESAKLQNLMSGLIAAAQESGEVPRSVSATDLTAILAALIDGLSLHAMLYPDRFPPHRMTNLMDQVIDSLLGTESPVKTSVQPSRDVDLHE